MPATKELKDDLLLKRGNMKKNYYIVTTEIGKETAFLK
jgi:hypothetical protein